VLSTSARILRLLTTLQSRRHWSGAELAEKLEVTPRTLRRDVDRLRSLGYVVGASAGPGGGYQLGASTTLPPLLLRDEEAIALAASLRAAVDAFAGVDDAVLGVLVKLEQILPERLRRKVGALHSMTISVGRGDAVNADVLVAIASACRNAEELAFEYRKPDGSKGARRVEPLRLAHAESRRWYLLAWDLDRAGWRTFRVDRIRSPAPGARFVQRPAPPDLERYIGESLTTSSYPLHARFRLFGSAKELRARIPSWLGRIDSEDAGSCILTIGAPSLEDMVPMILCAGVEFELLEPEALRPHLQQAAARLQGG